MYISLDKISYLVRRQGESISSMEKKAGLSNGIVRRWAKNTSPTLEQLSKLCNYLGVTLDEIIDGQKHSKDTLEKRQLELYQELYKSYQTLSDRNLKNPLQLTLSSVAIGDYLNWDESEVVMAPVYKQLIDIVEKQEIRRIHRKEKS